MKEFFSKRTISAWSLALVAGIFSMIGIAGLLYSSAESSINRALEAEKGSLEGASQSVQSDEVSGDEYATLGTTEVSYGAKQFFLHQQAPPSLGYLADNPAQYDALPFDGSTFLMDGFTTKVMSQEAVDGTAITQYISQINGTVFSRARHNWALVYATPAGPFSDFSVTASNFGKLAAAIAANPNNIEGIFFDNEQYFGSSWADCGGAAQTECRVLAHQAGKKVMQAIIANWPKARVMTLHGPGLSAPESSDWYNQYVPYNDVAWANPFQGNFIAGMVDATVGTQARYIDGGEIYQLQTEEQFLAARQWMKTGLAAVRSIVPASLAEIWPVYSMTAFGTYDWPEGFRAAYFNYRPTQTAAMIESENTNAIAASDKYAWFYNEQHNFAGNPRSNGKPDLKTTLPDWYAALEAAYASR